MKFRLEFDIKKFQPSITHEQKLLLVGSCFTENIGEKFDRYKFTILQNPNGILFNPVSVAESLLSYIDNRKLSQDNLFQYQGLWHSWKHHSRFSSVLPDTTLDKINTSIDHAHHYIQTASCLMITLGSAWTYELTANAMNAKAGDIASNNHKAPSNWFVRKLMNVEDVIAMYLPVIKKLERVNPDLRILFTISPVRHIKEGVIDNNRSKAVLIQAVHQLVDLHDHLFYFPAYELVIDDLRDYRYYAEDLVHPNYFATQYVWEKFADACFSEKTKILMEDINSIYLAFKHKPLNHDSSQHKEFIKKYYLKTRALQLQHPYLDFKSELEYFRVNSE